MAKREFPPVFIDELAGGALLCTSTTTMTPGSPPYHVRLAEFRLPRMKKPVVTATVVPTNSPGPSFSIFSVKVNDLPKEKQTQVAVQAQYASNGIVAPAKPKNGFGRYKVACSIMVRGIPA